MKRNGRILVAVLAVSGVAVAAYAALGGYNVAADEPHWQMTSSLLRVVRTRSIAARSSEIVVPPLDDEARIRTGAGNYDAMCAGCHLRPGEENSELRAGLYPAPPDLTRHELHDPAAAFWVVKHGIKMSGMPAWGSHMQDEYIWGLVAFLKRLPSLSSAAYQELLQESGGHSHDGMEADDHHTEAAAEAPEAPHEHADGKAHEH
ncbi:MAG: cytochrome c [Steroidobacteraceae bacterium]